MYKWQPDFILYLVATSRGWVPLLLIKMIVYAFLKIISMYKIAQSIVSLKQIVWNI